MNYPTLVNWSNEYANCTVNSDKFSIGRGLINSYVVKDLLISRVHCIFEVNDGAWTLSDKSTNGTWVNAEKLGGDEKRLLQDGDVIHLHDSLQFTYRAYDESRLNSGISDEEMNSLADKIFAEAESVNSDIGNKECTTVTSNNGTETGPSVILHNVVAAQNHDVTVLNCLSNLTDANNIIEPNFVAASVANIGNSALLKPFTSTTNDDVTATSSSVKSQTNETPLKENIRSQSPKNSIGYDEDELECSICTEMFIKAVTLCCSHTFCKYCITQWTRTHNVCPICRAKITVQFPTLVLDNLIEKIIEKSSEEVRLHRQEVIVQRQSQMPTTSHVSASSIVANNPPASTSRNPRTLRNDEPIEVSSSETDEDFDDDDMSDYSGSDWEADYNQDGDWDLEYNGLPGCYYGGYGFCYVCGQRGHWANGCPSKHRF